MPLVHAVLLAIVALSLLLMLWRPRDWPEAWWVCGGALSLVVLRLVPVRSAGHAVAEGTDVYLFLTGMMLLSGLAREQGVFDWVASVAVRRARGSSASLFLLLYVAGTIVTICMSNDATAVVLTPAVLAAARRAKAQPLPLLFVCAMIANAASFVLPISNPANLVVFRGAMPSLSRWLAAFAVPSLLSILATYLVLRWYFRKDLQQPIEPEREAHQLTATGKIVTAGLGVVVLVLLAASAFRIDLGLPTCVAAIVVALVVSARARQNPVLLLREVSWTTLLLVAGLFVMVQAVESIGALQLTGRWLAWCAHLAPATGAAVVGFAVGVGNNLLNNLPLGLLAGATVAATHTHGLLANAVLIGVDLGPNLSVTGSLATILWLLALRREKLNVSAWDFFKVGALAMPVALAAALGGLVAMNAIGH
ncbi:arsenite efflux membrane protein ArsB [Bryocella elongata]|uniref:Arsenite efflux membrane protein ArsB n=1 Tax=Bryocella elongata TaxID=863522 RepID=A0A1H6B0Z7_9BACT|nr:SLC13 family permease [Bryocella elongata]SEG54523.1 arsenite efflux membrane protein ArsB [Bryocella elongata]